MLTKTNLYSAGDIVAMKYVADPETFHERLILHQIGGDEVLTYTPDGDVYPLTLSVSPLQEIWARPRGGRYRRARADEVYRLEDGTAGMPTLEEFRALQKEHDAEARELQVEMFGGDAAPSRHMSRATWYDDLTGASLPSVGLPLGSCFLGDKAVYIGDSGDVCLATRTPGGSRPPCRDDEPPPGLGANPFQKLYQDVNDAKLLGTSDAERLRRMGGVLSHAGAGDPEVQDIAAELGCRDGRFDGAARPDDIVARLRDLSGGRAQGAAADADASSDARTLPIVRGPDGIGCPTFREAAAVRRCTQSEFKANPK